MQYFYSRESKIVCSSSSTSQWEIHKEEYAHNEVMEYACNLRFLVKGSHKINFIVDLKHLCIVFNNNMNWRILLVLCPSTPWTKLKNRANSQGFSVFSIQLVILFFQSFILKPSLFFDYLLDFSLFIHFT